LGRAETPPPSLTSSANAEGMHAQSFGVSVLDYLARSQVGWPFSSSSQGHEDLELENVVERDKSCRANLTGFLALRPLSPPRGLHWEGCLTRTMRRRRLGPLRTAGSSARESRS